MSGPLSGVRVLDFTALVQGPMATQMLGDLGADVIKIEKVGGEWMRFWGILNGKSHGEMDSFLAFNRNKRSAEADLRDPQIRDRMLELAAEADVVVENFRPGVMARLGLAYEDVRAVNPRIIYASSSGYGQSGPYVQRPGQDLLIQALSGLMFLSGRAGDPPTAHGVGVTDQYTALHIVIAVLAALHHREQTGEGQKVEVDLFSCTVAMQQQELTFYRNQGFLPERAVENLLDLGDRAVRDLRDLRRPHRDRDDTVPGARRRPRPALARRVRHARQDGRVAGGDLCRALGTSAHRHARALDRGAALPRRLVCACSDLRGARR